jgi:hypothetical protein
MAQYYVSITSFDLGDEASLYIDTLRLRITELTRHKLGDEFWKDYGRIYKSYRDSGKLMFRAKIVKDTKVFVKQIWDSKQSREQFALEAGEKDIQSVLDDLNVQRDFYFIDEEDIDTFINDILEEKQRFVQHATDKLRRSGMIIGDPLKGDVLIHVK